MSRSHETDPRDQGRQLELEKEGFKTEIWSRLPHRRRLPDHWQNMP